MPESIATVCSIIGLLDDGWDGLGATARAHIARAMHAGANEYIMKPFDKDIVEAKFAEVGLI